MAIAVAAISLTPVGYLFATGISFDDIRRELRYPSTVAAIVQTVQLTVLIAALTIVIGVACAALVVRTTVRMPRLLTVLFAAPLAVPGFVSSYAVYSAQLLYVPKLDIVTSKVGAAVVIALTLYPYVFLPSVVALREVDPSLEEMAVSLGRGRASRWRHVVLPTLRPAIAAGVLIVTLHVLSEFGAMEQLRRSTLTTKIMAEMVDYGNYRSARSLSLLLAALSMIVLVITTLMTPRRTSSYRVGGARRPPRQRDLGWATIPVTIGALALPLASLGPSVFMTVRGLLNGRGSVTVNWASVFGDLRATLTYAFAAAAVATVAALPVSWWINRRGSVASVLTERAVWLAHAVPSAILAFSLVYLATRLVPSMYKTPPVLVAGYVVLFLPLAVAYQRVGLEASRRTYDEVAASLGSHPVRTFQRVVLPLALPGFIAGAILVGLDASKELTATLMLVPYNTDSLATRLWATTNGEALDFTAAAPYAMMLLLLGSAPVYALVRHALQRLAPSGA